MGCVGLRQLGCITEHCVGSLVLGKRNVGILKMVYLDSSSNSSLQTSDDVALSGWCLKIDNVFLKKPLTVLEKELAIDLKSGK